jgi:hypothetical protein
MNPQTVRRLAAAGMASAAVLAIAGFTALGSLFEYPQILQSPTADILDLYRRHQVAVSAWFFVLVLSAAALAPVGLLLGRAVDGDRGRWIARLGVLAATVQVIGLARWVVLVPAISRDATEPSKVDDAFRRFELLHIWLGTVLGETVGYALTAAFTVLVASTVTRAMAPWWMVWLGHLSAALIATGVVVPLGVHAATLTNFAGYVGWCLWLIGMAVMLWRHRSVTDDSPARGGRSSNRTMTTG